MPVLSDNSTTSSDNNRESNVSFSTHIVQNQSHNDAQQNDSVIEGDEMGTGRTFKIRFQENLLRFDQEYPEGLELRISKAEFDSVMGQINTEQLAPLDKTQRRIRKWWAACAVSAPVAVGFFLTPVLAHHVKKHHKTLKKFWLGLRTHLKELNRTTYFARGVEWRIAKDVEKVEFRGAYNRLYVFRIEIIFRKPIKQRAQSRLSTAGSLRSLNMTTPTLPSTTMSNGRITDDPQLIATLTTGQDFDILQYTSGTEAGAGVEDNIDDDQVDSEGLSGLNREEELNFDTDYDHSQHEDSIEEEAFFKVYESPKTRLARANSLFMPPSPTPAPAFSLSDFSDVSEENEKGLIGERAGDSIENKTATRKVEKMTYAALLRKSILEDADKEDKDLFKMEEYDKVGNNKGKVRFEEPIIEEEEVEKEESFDENNEDLFLETSESPITESARANLKFAPPSPTPSPIYRYNFGDQNEDEDVDEEKSVEEKKEAKASKSHYAKIEPKSDKQKMTFADLLRESVLEDRERTDESKASKNEMLLAAAAVGGATAALAAITSSHNKSKEDVNNSGIVKTAAVVTETTENVNKNKIVERTAEERQKAFALRQRKKFTRTLPLTQLYDIPETPESTTCPIADAVAYLNATDKEAEEKMALEFSAYSKADPFSALYEDETDVIPIQPAHHQSFESFSKSYPKERERIVSTIPILTEPELKSLQSNLKNIEISEEEYCDVDGEEEIIRSKKWRVDPERAEKLPKISTQIESIKPASNRNSYSPLLKTGIITRKFDFKSNV